MVQAPGAKVFCFFFAKKKAFLALRLTCPFCGDRSIAEFSYYGDATVRRPGSNAEQSAWVDYVYMRDNVAGSHCEFWYHEAACRQVLTVERDTRTHAILSVQTP